MHEACSVQRVHGVFEDVNLGIADDSRVDHQTKIRIRFLSRYPNRMSGAALQGLLADAGSAGAEAPWHLSLPEGGNPRSSYSHGTAASATGHGSNLKRVATGFAFHWAGEDATRQNAAQTAEDEACRQKDQSCDDPDAGKSV